MPTTIRREDGADRSMLMISSDRGPSWLWPFATLALDFDPLGRSSLGPGRYVGAGWRGMPARAICCEPDSGKCRRQAWSMTIFAGKSYCYRLACRSLNGSR